MSETTIEDLPLEILTKILENLSVRDMKSASLACQLWNEIISTSSKFLEKTLVTINVNSEQLEAAQNVELCRKYRHVSVFRDTPYASGLEFNQIKKFNTIIKHVIHQISNFAIFIQKLNIFSIDLNGNQFLYFLRSCFSLEGLEMLGVESIEPIIIDCFEGPKEVVIEKKLKMLKLSECDWILKYLTIKNANLDHLILENSDETNNASTFLAFLHRLENVSIEELCLCSAYMKSNFQLCPKFKWKKLDFSYYPLISRHGLEAFEETIESDTWNQILSVAQVDSFVDLSWFVPIGTRQNLLTPIVENNNITRLKLAIYFIHGEMGEIFDRDQLKTFKYIKELEISTFFRHPEFPISQFPNVESVKVSVEKIDHVILNWEKLADHFQMTSEVEEGSDHDEEFFNELITKSFEYLYHMLPKAKIFEIEIENLTHIKTRQQIESEIFANRL